MIMSRPVKPSDKAQPLSDIVKSISAAEGRARTKRYLASRPFPHFETARDRPGSIIKIDEDGTRTVGRFVNRKFRPGK